MLPFVWCCLDTRSLAHSPVGWLCGFYHQSSCGAVRVDHTLCSQRLLPATALLAEVVTTTSCTQLFNPCAQLFTSLMRYFFPTNSMQPFSTIRVKKTDQKMRFRCTQRKRPAGDCPRNPAQSLTAAIHLSPHPFRNLLIFWKSVRFLLPAVPCLPVSQAVSNSDCFRS